jgi:hypothetical protein
VHVLIDAMLRLAYTLEGSRHRDDASQDISGTKLPNRSQQRPANFDRRPGAIKAADGFYRSLKGFG